ncbi:MAG: gliding motility-associated C-terminal domain-containing protein [Cytophagales bacterium]|nr:MAG: gliding motility-associated C-terminal domain-containing protein [Cytophagales bacterium]
MKKAFLYLFLVILLANTKSRAQIDTAFWIALPDLYSKPNNNITHFKLSSSYPGAGSYYHQRFYTDNKGKVKNGIRAWGAMIMEGIQYGWSFNSLFFDRNQFKDLSRMAVNFTVSKPSTCFYEITNPSSSDIFSMKGFNGLGTTFVVPFQDVWDNDLSGEGSTLDIVATENNTAVIITPSNNLKNGNPAGKPFAVSMTRGQTYRVSAASYLRNQRLFGTIIKSNKPIAVTMTNYEVKYDNNLTDLNGDQLIPVEVIGSEYILVRGRYGDTDALGNYTSLDRYFITAVYDNTEINIGGTIVATLNAGQSYDRIFPNATDAEYVKCSNPVYVYQISGMGNQPGGALVPSINCNGNKSIRTFLPTDYAVTVPDILNKPNHNFYKSKYGFMLFVKKGGENNFNQYTSNSFLPYQFPIKATDFKDVPNTSGEWKYGFFDITPYTFAGASLADFRKSLLGTGYGDNTSLIFFKAEINNAQNFHAAMVSSAPETGKLAYFTNFIDLKLPDTANVGCRGDSVYLFAGAGGSDYQWSFKENGIGGKINISNKVFIYAKKPGMYYVQKQTEECFASDSVWVKFEPPVKPKIGNDTTICAEAYTPFTLNAFNQKYIYYRWNDDIDINLPSLVAENPGTYIVETIDANFCMTSDTINIRYGTKIINNDFQKKLSICENDTISIGPQPNINYIYAWNIAQGISNQNISRPLYKAQTQYNTYVLTTSAPNNPCKLEDSIFIKILPLPVFGLGKDTIFCATTSYKISLNPSFNYTWKPSNLFTNPQNFSQTISSGINDSIIVEASINGCIYIDTIFINSGKPIITNPFPNNYNLCENDSILIGPEKLPNDNYRYQWIPFFALDKPNNSPTWYKQGYPGLRTQYFILKISEQNNPCQKEENLMINIKEAPKKQTSDTTLCLGDSIIFTLNPSYSYLWTSHSTPNNISTSRFQILKPNQDEIITFTSLLNNCKNEESIQIKVFPKPSLSLTGEDSLCEGEQLLIRAIGAKEYSWNNGNISTEDFFIDFPTQNQIYYVKGFNEYNCFVETEHNVYIWPKTPLKFKSNEINICFEQDSLMLDTLILTSSNDYKILFQNKPIPQNKVNEYGTYYITVRNSKCETKDSLNLRNNCNSGIFVPKSFSPNQDGINDYFEILLNKTNLEEISIYNRWGEIIFQSNNASQAWDGTSFGKIIPTGVYPWQIKYKNEKGILQSLSGSINLIR